MYAMFWFILAVIFNLFAIGGFYACWLVQRRRYVKSAIRLLSLVLLFSSLYCWSVFAEIEFGIIYFSLVSTLIALSILIGHYQFKPRKIRQRPIQFHWLSKAVVIHSIATFFVAGPIAFLVSSTLGFLFAIVMLEETGSQVVAAAFVSVIIWGLACFWVCAQDGLFKPTVSLLFLGLASGFLLSGAVV